MKKYNTLDDLIKASKDNIEYKYEGLVLDVTEAFLVKMEEDGISRKHLAERLRVNPSFITKLLNGTNMTIRQMLRVCEALDCEMEIKVRKKKKEKAEILYFKNPTHTKKAKVIKSGRSAKGTA